MDNKRQINRVVTPREWLWVAGASFFILALTTLPVVWGYIITPADRHFSGIVYYWEDANSYLAKVRQGFRGEWLYTPPYTDSQAGLFLHMTYIWVGQAARLLSLSPIIGFHLARLASGAIMLFSLYGFTARFWTEVHDRRLAFLLAALGS